MPIDYSLYPKNWKAVRERILERANQQCERCGVTNYARGARDKDGVWHSETAIENMKSDVGFALFGEYPKIIRIVLTIAHVVDADPMNVADSNLLALCQRCHLRQDSQLHAKTRRANRDKKTGQGRLF